MAEQRDEEGYFAHRVGERIRGRYKARIVSYRIVSFVSCCLCGVVFVDRGGTDVEGGVGVGMYCVCCMTPSALIPPRLSDHPDDEALVRFCRKVSCCGGGGFAFGG